MDSLQDIRQALDMNSVRSRRLLHEAKALATVYRMPGLSMIYYEHNKSHKNCSTSCRNGGTCNGETSACDKRKLLPVGVP
jgi:hypothetical protein